MSCLIGILYFVWIERNWETLFANFDLIWCYNYINLDSIYHFDFVFQDLRYAEKLFARLSGLDFASLEEAEIKVGGLYCQVLVENVCVNFLLLRVFIKVLRLWNL